jgi:hypothetical protein
MNLRLLRQFIREQMIRGAYTEFSDPITFEDFPDYDIDIISNVNGKYLLTVKFKDEKISQTSAYNDYDEAHHQARMIIDKHRVQIM